MSQSVEKALERYTVEEYFKLEYRSDVRYEFYNGEVVAMAGDRRTTAS